MYQNNISYDDLICKFREIYKKCFDSLNTDLKNSIEIQLQIGIVKKIGYQEQIKDKIQMLLQQEFRKF